MVASGAAAAADLRVTTATCGHPTRWRRGTRRRLLLRSAETDADACLAGAAAAGRGAATSVLLSRSARIAWAE